MQNVDYTKGCAEEYALCLRLFSLVEEENQEPLDEKEPADRIIFQLGARSIKTYRAALHLCHLGHGEQATMLARSLFEDMIIAHWVLQNPEAAVERLKKHERHYKGLWREHFEERGMPLGPFEEIPEFTPEEREDLEKLFGARGDRRWTGLSPREMIKAIEQSWGDKFERQLLRHMHDVHLRHANMSLHATAESLKKPKPSDDDPDLLLYDSAPSENDVLIALLEAFWCYANLFRIILPPPSRDAIFTFYRKGLPSFFRNR